MKIKLRTRVSNRSRNLNWSVLNRIFVIGGPLRVEFPVFFFRQRKRKTREERKENGDRN